MIEKTEKEIKLNMRKSLLELNRLKAAIQILNNVINFIENNIKITNDFQEVQQNLQNFLLQIKNNMNGKDKFYFSNLQMINKLKKMTNQFDRPGSLLHYLKNERKFLIESKNSIGVSVGHQLNNLRKISSSF